MTNQERAAKANIARYNESKAYYLSDVYTKYSKAKEKALTDCIRLMKGVVILELLVIIVLCLRLDIL